MFLTQYTNRGFILVEHPSYPGCETKRLIQESSAALGKYPDCFHNPGSSALWIGKDHHLDREEVAELIRRLQHWLDNKRLPAD